MGIASSIIGGVGALGSAIYGAVTSSKANNKARALIQQQRDDNQKWWDVKRSQDYTQRSDVQAALNKQKEMLEEQTKRARATNAVAGGTDEALALQKAAANKALAQTTTDIASNASAYKDNMEAQYRQQDAALNQQQIQNYQQQAQQAAAAASQGVNAGLNLVGQGIVAKAMQVPVDAEGDGNKVIVDPQAYNHNVAVDRMAQINAQYQQNQLDLLNQQNKNLLKNKNS